MKTRKMWCCDVCGSTDVLRDAYVAVNDPDDVREFDQTYCEQCADECGIELREVLGEAPAAAPQPVYLVIQEGGTSEELYVHETKEAAIADRVARAEGAYGTSRPIVIDPRLAALGEVFYTAVEDILSALNSIETYEGEKELKPSRWPAGRSSCRPGTTCTSTPSPTSARTPCARWWRPTPCASGSLVQARPFEGTRCADAAREGETVKQTITTRDLREEIKHEAHRAAERATARMCDGIEQHIPVLRGDRMPWLLRASEHSFGPWAALFLRELALDEGDITPEEYEAVAHALAVIHSYHEGETAC